MSTLAVRADAHGGTGVGHVMRSVGLCDAWRQSGGDAIFFTVSPPPLVNAVLERRGLAVQSYPSPDAAWDGLVGWVRANRDAWVVFDTYALGGAAQRSIRAAGARLLVIDDCKAGAEFDCDVLLNQNIGAGTLGYRVDERTRCCFGPTYALLRREFLRAQPANRFEPLASRIVVTFGGADVHDQASRIARILAAAPPPLEATIVAGQLHGVADPEPPGAEGVQIRWQPANEDMPTLLAAADMAICAAGTTCWELAHFGVPALTLVVADNQLGVAAGLHDAGVVRNLGWFDAVSDAELGSAIEALRRDGERREMSRRGRALVDGRGADRVVDAMRHLEVRA